MATSTNPLAPSPEVRALVREILEYRRWAKKHPLMEKWETAAQFRERLLQAKAVGNRFLVRTRPLV